MNIKAIIFDLDDTLYPEKDYRQSGFDHVAKIVSSPGFIRRLIDDFEISDGQPLTALVEYLVDEYRGHSPTISCYDDTREILNRLKAKYKLGLITNNVTGAQRKKLDALGIEDYFDSVVFADPPDAKPSDKPYLEALGSLRVEPQEAVYVGDNIEVDFIAANRLGIHTVQIHRPDPIEKHVDKGQKFRAKHEINSLGELCMLLESMEAGA